VDIEFSLKRGIGYLPASSASMCGEATRPWLGHHRRCGSGAPRAAVVASASLAAWGWT
jgi:hypothetical protein